MNIIGYKYVFLSVSAVLVLASLASLAFFGLKLGIDFTGGSFLEVEFLASRPSLGELQKAISELELGNVIIQHYGEKGTVLRLKDVDEKTHQEILSRLDFLASKNLTSGAAKENSTNIIEKRFDTIGPTIGAELRKKSLIAIAVTLVLIVLYIAWAFRKVSRPVSSWKYGVTAVIALVHDVTIPTGIFAILGHFKGVEIDTLFVTALLTILGFSVHDTIVVFDRVRENLKKSAGSYVDFSRIVNQSIQETIARSINTSLTVILVLLAVMFFGGETTFYFALLLILGIFFGTYSSIFIASPLLVIWQGLPIPKKDK